MSPDLLPAIAAFARVAQHESFARAAAELGISPSAMSQTVRKLEDRLGVRLLERSTRRVSVTEVGERFLREAQPALALLTTAVEEINDTRGKAAGLLRLNVSRTVTDILVMDHIVPFMNAYPDITVELHCYNAMVDIVAGGFDAGIRLGENLAKDVVAVPLGGVQRLATFAAPSYLEGRTLPLTPEDLSAHRCLNGRLGGGIYRWEYSNKGRDFDVAVDGPLIANDGQILLDVARAGGGIACAFEKQVQQYFETGRLVPLLEPWWPTFPGFYLYYASRLHTPRKLKVFIEFMQARLNTHLPKPRRRPGSAA